MLRIKSGIIFIILFFVLFISYFQLFRTIGNHSDDASILLQAKSFIEGNFILRGWSTPPDSFWTIDILLHSIFMIIIGFSPILMDLVPAFIYSGIVTCSLILVKNRNSWKESTSGILVTLAIAAFPSFKTSEFISHSPIHLGTILFLLVAIVLFNDLGKNKSIKIFIIILLFLLSAIGDPYAIYVFLAPFTLVHLLKILKEDKKDEIKKSIFWVVSTVGVILLSKLILWVVTKFGGFYAHPETSIFVEIDQLSFNIRLTLSGILDLFGANFFGNPLKSLQTVEHSYRLFILCISLIIFKKLFFQLNINKNKIDSTTIILLFSILTTILAYLLSTQPTDSYSTRFLFPVFIFGSVLVGRNISLFMKRKMVLNYSSAILLLVALLFYFPRALGPTAINPTKNLTDFLESKDLKVGYSEFWTASIATVNSEQKINIRPIASDKTRIAPINWLSQDVWYQEPAHFLVFDDIGSGNLSYDTATNFFGEEDEKYHVGKYTILVWRKNIALKNI